MDRRMVAVAIGALLTAGGVAAAHSLRADHAEPAGDVRFERFPRDVGSFAGFDLEVNERVLDELRSDALLLREYAAPDDGPVWLYVDYHRAQRLGAQIHSPRACYPGAGWAVLEASTAPRTVGSRVLPICWLTLGDSDGNRRIAAYWFETRWGATTGELSLKTHLLRSAASRRPTDAALVRLSTDADPSDLAPAFARLERFLDQVGAPLEAELLFERDPG